jgi:phosphoesterase RecJ-like protein
VETLKEMKGLEVAALLREIGEHRYKISMRSKGSIDVASVGRVFGGGGHRKAAGCVIEGTMDEVKKKLVEALNA